MWYDAAPFDSGGKQLPDATNKMSPEDRTLAAERINATAQHDGDPCPHCGDKNTSVAEDVFRLAVVDKPIPQRFVPVIPVVCNNCGFVRIFSSRMVGIEPYLGPREPSDEGAE